MSSRVYSGGLDTVGGGSREGGGTEPVHRDSVSERFRRVT